VFASAGPRIAVQSSVNWQRLPLVDQVHLFNHAAYSPRVNKLALPDSFSDLAPDLNVNEVVSEITSIDVNQTSSDVWPKGWLDI
jgi:hypothetical protein